MSFFARPILGIAALFAMSGAFAATPTVLDFQNLTHAGSGTSIGQTYLASGYRLFTGAQTGFTVPAVGVADYVGSTALWAGGGAGADQGVITTQLQRTDGKTFDFDGLSLAVPVGNQPAAITFLGLDAWGNVLASQVVDATQVGTGSFSAVTFGSAFDKVTLVSWRQAVDSVNTYQFDDIRLDGGVAAVPEPQTYALMAAGLGVMVFLSRRRTRA